jgi:fructosamine-3-kinase
VNVFPELVRRWLREHGYGPIVSTRSVKGGCINQGMIIRVETGDTFFLKTNANAPTDMFAKEAQGLQALQVEGGPVVPRVYAHDRRFLLLEDLSPQTPSPQYWQVFGKQLANLHLHTGSAFGFEVDNYIGRTPQPNPWTEDGAAFFADHRLRHQVRLAQEKGYLTPEDVDGLEKIARRLPDLIPDQPPSLMHGDLWSGNAISDSRGLPALIDPAVHYGWAEAELAMTTLFGSFPDRFYRAYEEVRPLERGFRGRFPIYNLYHLLNHVVLFGTSYLTQVRSILNRYQ